MNVRRLWRALRSRWGSTGLVGVVALCAVAAAVSAPSYDAAARTSIVHDTFERASVLERGVQVKATGGLASTAADPLAAAILRTLADQIGAARTRDLISGPIVTFEADAFLPKVGQSIPVVSRTGICANLRITQGVCPSRTNDVVISNAMSRLTGVKVGDTLAASDWPQLHVVGRYDPMQLGSAYWFGAEPEFFPQERPSTFDITAPSAYDAMFGTMGTLDGDPTRQGSYTVTALVDVARLQPRDVDGLAAAATALEVSQDVSALQATVATSMPAAAQTVHASWDSLSVPVVVITVELVVVAWLLLFLLVVGIADARADEVALARLRGQRGARVLGIGLGEPLLLLAAALPLGAVAGWGVARLLTSETLRAGTATPLPALAWATAAATVLGGVAATILAGWRALRTEVVDARQTSRSGRTRGWVLDAVVLTAAVAGLVQLGVSGAITRSSNGGIVLLAPALAVLAVAIVASRLLPIVCRALFPATRARGSIAVFLAVRAIARRPNGSRMVMLVATATGLLTFAVGAWSSGNTNRSHVAAASLGAARVLTVAPIGADALAADVSRADPGGTSAGVVLRYDNGQAVLLAVQPDRFAHVASWASTLASPPDAATLAKLHPTAPTPVVLGGDRVRMTVRTQGLTGPVRVSLDVITASGQAVTPVDLGQIGPDVRGKVMTAALPGAPARLVAINFSPVSGAQPLAGTVSISGLQRIGQHGAQPVVDALAARRWTGTGTQALADRDGGLLWSFSVARNASATLQVDDHPSPVPALVADTSGGPPPVSGIDGGPLSITAVDRFRAVPGAPNGAVVALDYAELAAASSDYSASDEQVWLRAGADPSVEQRLRALGVHIVRDQSVDAVTAELRREGPGLAALLFVVNAVAATALAALGATASFWADGRRRRYEYAALLATGVKRRTLRAGAVIEQLLTLLFASAVGIAVGYAVMIAVLPDVPQFVEPPPTPVSYAPSVAVVVVAVAVAVAIIAAMAIGAASLLVRQVRPDLLREGNP